jgi:hypothetical protein
VAKARLKESLTGQDQTTVVFPAANPNFFIHSQELGPFVGAISHSAGWHIRCSKRDGNYFCFDIKGDF